MKKIVTVLFTQFILSVAFADNPVIQNYYSADPAPMVYNDRVYLFTSHDEDVTESGFFTMRNWMCYSSSDMVNWTDHGIVASLKDFKWLGTLNNGAWAPQCVHRAGKFYLYVPIQGKGIGVLVSDKPTGPFTDPIGKALVNKNGYDDIDPTAFVDSDGQAYLYWGNPKLWYVKLNEDMISYSGNVVEVSMTVAGFGQRTPADTKRPTSYEEGPWFYKRENIYYMVFAGGPVSEHIGHSTSTGPTGPWTYRGVVMPSTISKAAFTNHPGVCDFKGNSYFFYHNQGLTGGGGYKRSVCVEQFTYKSDGSIPQISSTTNGPNQVGSLNPYDTVQAETVCLGQGVETQTCNEGGICVTSIENGDYIKVKGVDFGTEGAVSFDARVATGNSGAKIELHLGSATGTLIGTCDVGTTGGAQTWSTKSCTVTNAKGKNDLYLKFTGSGTSMFNFNWWKFKSDKVGTIADISRAVFNSLKISANKQVISVSSGSLPVSIQKITVDLYTMSGRLIMSKTAEIQSELTLDPGLVQSGMYLVKVSIANKSVTHSVNIQ
jgi:hypothetical protein